MPVQTIHYTPEWHSRLLEYMKSVFPHRNPDFLNWWITNIDHSDVDCWQKCLIILENDSIIGCTTANLVDFCHQNKTESFFFRGNTIISPDQRGKGISKEIYNRVNSYNNWISVGITDIAWKIQPKYVKNFTSIRPINVYIGLNRNVICQLLRKILHKSGSLQSEFSFPPELKMNGSDKICRVRNVSELEIPDNGHWTTDELEPVRDEEFIKKRFFDIYCAQRYAIYQYIAENKCIGYVILRKALYKGLEMISLVDYRFHSRKDEIKAFKVASKLARKNHIGLVIALSSRNYGSCLTSFIVKMKKKLNCAIGSKDYCDKFNKVLFTSADSDLDFVYYK